MIKKNDYVNWLLTLEQIEQASILLVGFFSLYLDGVIACFDFSEKTDEQSAERDQIRQERHKERQRAAALQRAGGDKR